MTSCNISAVAGLPSGFVTGSFVTGGILYPGVVPFQNGLFCHRVAVGSV